jgi:sporulation protein YlmC with PRC-barrel domain
MKARQFGHTCPRLDAGLRGELSVLSGMDYQSLQGRTVYSVDGERIGKIADLYDDTGDGPPVFATVNTGLFGSSTTFVPLESAELRGDDLYVPYQKDFVKDAPRVTGDEELSAEAEREIFGYYKMNLPPASDTP